MNRAAASLLACIVAITAMPAVADTIEDTQKAIQADIDALHKDSEALKRDMEKLNKDRAAKAAAKSSNDTTGQVKSSLAIGADQAAISEKQAEKKVDQKILAHHKASLDDQIDKETADTADKDQTAQ